MKAALRLYIVAAAACAAAAPPASAADAPSVPLVEISQSMPEAVEAGAPFVIDIVVHNAGAAAAEGVMVTDRLPAGYDLLGAAPTPEHGADGLVWRLGRLPPGGQTALRLRLGPKPGEDAPPPHNVVDATFQSRATSECTGRVTRPELSLTVTAPEGAFTGQSVPFRIVIGNAGPGAARDVTLHALLGAGLDNPKGADLEAGVGALASGESRVVTLPTTAARAGEARCSFDVQAQGVAPVRRELVCRVEDDRLHVTATGPQTLRPEFTGLFGLAVVNDGATAARQVVLTATLPDGLTFVRATDDATYDFATHAVTWNLGDLQAGERREVAWNATAGAAGEQRARVRLSAGSQTRREIAWTTRVEDGAARPAAGAVARTPGE